MEKTYAYLRSVCLLGLVWIATHPALWWGGRFAVLPWLQMGPHLTTSWLRTGFVLLLAECGIITLAFGWLAVRPSF